jgi:hypothetical protein
MQIVLLGFRGAGSIIKPIKIVCYCGGKASYAQGKTLLGRVGTSNGFIPPQ